MRIIPHFLVLIIYIINCHSQLTRRALTFCIPPASPNNGQVSIGSVVTRFTCNPGHKLEGSPVAVCVAGQWSTPVPQCVAAAGGPRNNIKGEMDVELKDQQIVTAYTHFPKSEKTNRPKSNKRKSKWKKKRRKGRRKKSKDKANRISQSKKVSSPVTPFTKQIKDKLESPVENPKNNLSRKERRMKRRQERKRNKGKRKERRRRKGKRKNKKRRKKLKDKNKNVFKIDKNNDDNFLKQNFETNSIQIDNFINPKQLVESDKTNLINSSDTHHPKIVKIRPVEHSPKVIETSSDKEAHASIIKTKKEIPDYSYGIYQVDTLSKSDKVTIIPTETPKTDLLQEIIDRMMTRDGTKDSELLDDFMTLKVKTELKNVRPIKSKNEVRFRIPETSKITRLKNKIKSTKLKNNNRKHETDYEDSYDPDEDSDYSGIFSLNSSATESAPQQELPVGYPSLVERLYGRNRDNPVGKRFVEEEDLSFSELDTSCTISDTDSLYLPPPRIKNGHVVAYITVTNPAAPNNVYVEANYDCNFGYQLKEPTNSRLFCRQNSWTGVLPNCKPYITDDSICGVTNGGCQHICNTAENGTFICSCYRGFTLDEDKLSCKDIDECAANNGGCEGACYNKLGSYQCYCPEGYRVATNGKTCIDKNECILRNGHGPCQDTCFNTKGSYYCTCDGRPGTSLSSDQHSCEDLNECSVENGGCSHICLNTFGQTFCACPEGFTLTMDWKTCKDINECEYPDIARKCDLGCINTVGSYRCAVSQDSSFVIDCSDGETLSSDGKECVDINECLENNFGCSHLCLNTKGSAFCECPPSYELKDGKQCLDINECNGNNKCSHTCVNTDGSYECLCPIGRILTPDNVTCIDANECIHENGRCEQICVNLDGSHQCECEEGFVLIGDHTCDDIDECRENNAGCEQICTNEPGTFSCSCLNGYDLEGSMCLDIDECDLKIDNCEQNCFNSNGSYACSCYEGYELTHDGLSCIDVDECNDQNPCSHFCSNKNGSFICSCPTGWYMHEDGRNCVDIDECERSPCSHSCQNTEGGYKCTCPKGLRLIDEGTSAEKTHLCVDIDECNINNGNCSDICSNLEGSFECLCSGGFVRLIEYGVTKCQDMNECEKDNGGCSHQCINEDGNYRCDCPTGLKLNDDSLSCDDIDECVNDNGGCSHSCINLPGTYECTCPAGWEMFIDYDNEYDSNEIYLESLEPSWKTCKDIDECQLNNGGCSHVCVNGNGNFHCSCPAGYNLINDYSCEDINECMVDNGPCSQRCINIAGTFKCECEDGFQLVDGIRCKDVNECLYENICSHICINEVGTYKCLCPVGFVMENDNKTCSDFNECGKLNGGCSHTCQNNEGLYSCSCPQGMSLAKDLHICKDMDECVEQNGGCSHVCLNIIGSFICTCPIGLMLAVDGKSCLDIDECGKENGGCSDQCSNLVGHYTCLCPPGFQLQPDNHTCVDINECDIDNGHCSHKCYNLYGTYECFCPEGYAVKEDNYTCHDIDECQDQNGGCAENCHNTRGSYRCDCSRGYQLDPDLHSCKDIDECNMANGGCSHFCENMPGSFFCSCPTGYHIHYDGLKCIDVDECKLNPCEHKCLNTDGSFYCSCDEGYSSRPDSANLCHDINECELNNGGCSHYCFNTIGSYYCGCPSTLQLTTNNHSCDAKEIFCPLIAAPVNSYMTCSTDPITTAYKAGTSCSFSCQKGLVLQGKVSTNCGPDGSWSNVPPRCKDIVCTGVPNIEYGVITPYRCTRGTSKLDQHCYLTCNPGYRVVGNPVRSCKDPGTWSPTISPHCEKDSLKPFIQCPNDMTIELSAHQNFAYVRLPRPKSNVDWYRFIDSSHAWAKELEADIPAGATVITFTAHSPLSEEKASCTFEVFVKDSEIPQVFGCPKSFKLYLKKDEHETDVTWKEPVFKDNVEIVHVYKSMEPGDKIGLGTHPVHYIAVDPQGNRAKCSFVITVEAAQHVPEVYQSNEVWIVCSDMKERRPTRVPAWHVPQGCTVVNPSIGVSPVKLDITPTHSEVPNVINALEGEQQQTSVAIQGVSVLEAIAIANGREYQGPTSEGKHGPSITSAMASSSSVNHRHSHGIQSLYHDSFPFSDFKNARSFAIAHARAGSSGSSVFAHSQAGDNTQALAYAKARTYK